MWQSFGPPVLLSVCAAVLSQRVCGTLTKYRVHANVASRFVRTTVTLQLNNSNNCTDIGIFTLQLPREARLSDMYLTTSDGCERHSVVLEKAQASATFAAAAGQGQAAALISAYDVSIMKLSVAVPPETSAQLEVAYEEVLVRKGGLVTLVLPLAPGSPTESVEATLNISEPESGITSLSCTPSANGAEGGIVPTISLGPTTGYGSFATEGSASVFVPATASLVAGGLAERVACSYKPGPLPEEGLLLFDNSAHVLFLLNPPSLSLDGVGLSRVIVLVLDVSGSMSGQKLADAKTAIAAIMNTFGLGDVFKVATFSSSMPMDSWGPLPATADNKASAQNFIQGIEAGGGTNLHDACVEGIKLVGSMVTSWQVPILVLLTDGRASSGVTSTSAIRAATKVANSEIGASVYALAFGAGADYGLLLGITLDNQGSTRMIYEGYGDAAWQITNFFKDEIGSVLLGKVSMQFSGVTINEQTASEFPLLAAGSEIVVRGRAEGLGSLLTATTTGWGSGGPQSFATSRLLAPADASLAPGAGARGLAHVRIGELMDAVAAETAAGAAALASELKTAALARALGAGIVWPGLTSLVVVEGASCLGGAAKFLQELPAAPAICPNGAQAAPTGVSHSLDYASSARAPALGQLALALAALAGLGPP